MAKADKKGRPLTLAVATSEGDETKRWDVVFFYQFNMLQNGWAHMTNVVRIDKSDIRKQSVISVVATTNKGYSLVDNLKFTIIKEGVSH